MKKSLKHLLLTSWAGARETSKFLASMTLEEYVGYVVAMTFAQHPSRGFDPAEVLAETRELVKNSNI